MKIRSSLGVLSIVPVMLLLVISNVAYAEPQTGSGHSWDAKAFFQNLELAFTFDKAEKAHKALVFARESLEGLNNTPNAESLPRAKLRHDQFVQKAEESILELRVENHTSEFGKETELELELTELKYVLEKLKQEAQLEKREDIEVLLNQSQNKLDGLEIKLENIKQKTKVRYVYLDNKSLEEVESETSAYEKEKIDGKFEVRAKQIIEQAEFAIEKSQNKLEDKNSTSNPESKLQLGKAIALLANAQAAYEKKNYFDAANIALESKKLAVFASSGLLVESRGKAIENKATDYGSKDKKSKIAMPTGNSIKDMMARKLDNYSQHSP